MWIVMDKIQEKSQFDAVFISFHFIYFHSKHKNNKVQHKFKICKVIIKWRNRGKHT